MRRSILTTFLIASWVFGIANSLTQYQQALVFQNRGDRYEGLRTLAVGGFDIELLSARADRAIRTMPQAGPPSRPGVWSDTARLRFYLPETEKPEMVRVTVRQLRSGTTYYWLNQVKRMWRPRVVNQYEWSTKTVLKSLDDVRLEDLGATVRIANDDLPARVERVLPVVLFEEQPVDVARFYRFTFKTNGRAKVTASVHAGAAANSPILCQRPSTWEQAGSPFTVWCDLGTAEEGWYLLALSGYFENNTILKKDVLFYHRPSLLMGLP